MKSRIEENILAHKLPLLQNKVAKLNRRGAKLGCEPLTLTVLGGVVVWGKLDPNDPENRTASCDPRAPGARIWQRRLAVELVGESPTLNGWQLVAVVEHTPAGNVIRGEDYVPPLYRERGPVCDHCQHSRRRNETIMVRSVETGTFKQVGKSCVKDFLGHALTQMMFAATACSLKTFGGLDEDGGSREERSKYAINTAEYVAHAARSIRDDGWTPRSRADEVAGRPATADAALSAMFPGSTSDAVELTDEDRKRASAALNWVAGLEGRDLWSDYLSNLKTTCANDYLSRKLIGIAASVVSAYDRAMSKIEERKADAVQGASSDWVGELKARLDLKLTCIGQRDMESHWGGSTLCKFTDADGNRFAWFASCDIGFEIGDAVELRGTVKAHKEFNGTKETQLTRCKIA